MDLIATIIVCATVVLCLVLLLRHGFPTINLGVKVTHAMDQQFVTDTPLPDAAQVDLEQENLNKEMKIHDLAEAINSFLDGGELK